MSRYYETTIEVMNANPARVDAILEAIADEWNPDDNPYISHEQTQIVVTAKGSLCNAEGEDAAGRRIAQRIMAANGGPCQVSTQWTYLENLPYELHDFDESDYAIWIQQGWVPCEPAK